MAGLRTFKSFRIKKVLFLLFGLCTALYILLHYHVATEPAMLPAFNRPIFNNRRMYFVNTPGCMMPGFNVTDAKIELFMDKPANFSCSKPMLRTAKSGSQLWINMDKEEVQEALNAAIEDITCYYQEIKRLDGADKIYMKKMWFVLEVDKSVKIRSGIEFVKVHCESTESSYTDYFFFVPDKRAKAKGFEQQMTWTMPAPTAAAAAVTNASSSLPNVGEVGVVRTNASERLSVMVLGLDSVSHLNFLRQMPKTAAYIRAQLAHVEFWGFNKVGDNTFPNLIAMLTGQSMDEFKSSCGLKKQYVDNCSFVWSGFKAARYQTAYGEDCANMSLFDFMGRHFLKQPTDYYLNTVVREMEENLSVLKATNYNLCLGGRRSYALLFEFARKLMPFLATQDFFSFFWSATLTHDLFNMPSLMDDDLLLLLHDFKAGGVLDKTVVLLMSDHGMRWGPFRETYQGTMEERQPLLIALYPKWMRERYSAAIDNLEVNSARLVTHFDLHATLLDLMDLGVLHEDELNRRSTALIDAPQLPRSISLFLPVPAARSCENATIDTHWCTCHQRHLRLKTNAPRVRRATQFILQLINKRLEPYPQCHVLESADILKGSLAASKHTIVEAVSDAVTVDIMVRVQTKPGLAMFEATVRMSRNSIALTGTVSRINEYGNQSYCVDDNELKMFCFC